MERSLRSLLCTKSASLSRASLASIMSLNRYSMLIRSRSILQVTISWLLAGKMYRLHLETDDEEDSDNADRVYDNCKVTDDWCRSSQLRDFGIKLFEKWYVTSSVVWQSANDEKLPTRTTNIASTDLKSPSPTFSEGLVVIKIMSSMLLLRMYSLLLNRFEL